jgi:L-ascorbate metabolism protein UlaG (beta-lactamase superfamily)
MRITYYGHACFGAQVAGKSLLFDPFITANELARSVDVKAVPADYILVSHGHFDHLADAADIARRTGATLVSNFEIATWFGKQGIERTHGMNHGGGFEFDFGRVKFVSAIHSSGSGDTALTQDMKLIGEATKLNFAALPIGGNFTMGIQDAIKAADFVRCTQVLGVHYNTFPPIRIDSESAVARFKAADKQLHLLSPGQSITL